MAGTGVANIGIGGQRRRAIVGGISIAVGVAIVVAVTGASPGCALVAFVPFWFGALGVTHAREKT